MNFDFSDDQKMLKDQVAKFLADTCPITVTRRVLQGDELYAKEVWQGLAELGVLGAAIPEQYGGSGLGPLEVCVVAEELGRAVAPVPMLSSIYLAAEAINRFGSDAQKAKWLPKLADGSLIGTLAVAEGAHVPTPRSITTTLSGSKLSGTKLPVPDGEAAGLAIVVANTGGSGDRALSLALVDLAQSGIARKRVETVDPSRKHAELSFNNVAAEPLGPQGEGVRLLSELCDVAAIYLAFEQIGGAEAALWMARDYALERQAFGRQIGSYQGIKHKLADVYIKIQLARSNAYYGAMMLNDRGADLPVAAAATRVAGIEAYQFAAQEGLQTHGGIGFTWEANTQFHYRRAKLLGLALGGPMAWKDKLVTRLEKRNAA
jgi:alkylation response protein AidB-like acyl-CoA dehydrogenase